MPRENFAPITKGFLRSFCNPDASSFLTDRQISVTFCSVLYICPASYRNFLCLTMQAREPVRPRILNHCRKALKGRPAMQTSSPIASISMATPDGGQRLSRQTEELMYQGVTIAAILLVLGSLWIF